MQVREKVGKSQGRKVGSLKRRVRSHLARWEMKNCTPLWREAHFQVKMYKAPHSRTTFGCRKSARRCGAKRFCKWKSKRHLTFGPLLEVAMSKKVHAVVAWSAFASEKVKDTARSDHFWKLPCRKVHAFVARSTFPSQTVQRTPAPDHFWKLRCRNRTPLWREAHLQVNMLKAPHVRTTFGGSDAATTTPHDTPIHYTTTTTTPSLHSTTLHYTPLHSTTLHTTLHSITLNYTQLRSIKLN